MTTRDIIAPDEPFDPSLPVFTTAAISRITGVSSRDINHWIYRGHFPAVTLGRQGTQWKYFSFYTLVHIAAFSKLRKIGPRDLEPPALSDMALQVAMHVDEVLHLQAVKIVENRKAHTAQLWSSGNNPLRKSPEDQWAIVFALDSESGLPKDLGTPRPLSVIGGVITKTHTMNAWDGEQPAFILPIDPIIKDCFSRAKHDLAANPPRRVPGGKSNRPAV